MPIEPALQSLQGELEGNYFRGIDGFLTKYFEDQSWSATVADVLHRLETADVVNNLSASLWDLHHLDALHDWLATLQSLFFAADDPTICLRSEPIITTDSSLHASIHIRAHLPAAMGGTRVYGEYHDDAAPILSTDNDEFLRFAARALRTFNAQPARYFLHAFLLRGKTLELWVFDRSGAYSSETFNIAHDPTLPLRVLAGYGMMSDQECGRNMLIKTPTYLVGLGTVCFAASTSAATEPTIVVKFSWPVDTTPVELQVLERARDRKVWGILRLLECQDLVNIADFRHGLHFPRPYVNRTLSCVTTEPLGRPIRQFVSLYELLEVLRDLVKALKSLYMDGNILHRDIAIKNLVIAMSHNDDTSKGILIDFDLALDLNEAPAVQQMVGSDGFMAIGILSGHPHTYRHDLESLFYVFLWLAIGDDREHDHAHEILQSLPKTSRLWKWCSMDFNAVRQAKVADMSPEGFEHILNEFSAKFAPLRELANELHRLIFPIRDGGIFTKTETDQAAVERLYHGMADAFNQSILTHKD